jgi:septal ring factor EnvC (AmiA/AmiB activator)
VRRGGCSLRLAALVGASLATVSPAAAQQAAPQPNLQQELQQSQRRLEQIREERARLQEEMESVRTRVKDASLELSNVERRLSGSRSVLAEVQFQSDAVAGRIEGNNRELVRTRERLREGSATLNRRLRDIYKMGNLHTMRVLLGADSFTDLVNRYRYLRMIAAYDRALVERIGKLETDLLNRDRALQRDFAELGRLRQTRSGEVAELRSLEDEHRRALDQFRSRERQTQSRLTTLEADEGRMKGVIDELERRRIELARRPAAAATRPAAPTLAAADAGTLEWPVEGPVVYRFGREVRPNGTVLRWNGIGISAQPGTPVRAVKAGTVVLAGLFEGYGPTVVLSHGEGFYTLYLYLEDIGVVEGRPVAAGQVVGTVGGGATPEGPHIEFQVRAPQGGGSPQAQDPLQWLRRLESPR